MGNITSCTDLIKTCADSTRLRILALLARKKMCVCELAFVLGITQPAVSKHLKKMMQSGFVACEQDGLWTNYRLCPAHADARELVRFIRRWLKNDTMSARDFAKARKANREKLCCKK